MIILAIVGGVILSLILFTVFTVYPSVWLIRIVFKPVFKLPENYEETKKHTVSIDNIDYGSKFDNGRLDIIRPHKNNEKLPAIIWLHGGAYVTGDKIEATSYLTLLASQDYVCVNVNYTVAPKYKYPTPIIQLSEVYEFLIKNADKYGIDTSKLIFAGDSAGAQIATQFVNIQTNQEYAKICDIKPVINDISAIKGLVLCCGPYDLKEITEKSSSKLLRFFFQRVGRAYIGKQNWQASAEADAASVIDKIQHPFPPVFITDGNTFTFTQHGLSLAKRLEEQNIYVKKVFYAKEEAVLNHEYQFVMNNKYAENTYQELNNFLTHVLN